MLKLGVNSFVLAFAVLTACTAARPPTATLNAVAPTPIPNQNQATVAAVTPTPAPTQAAAAATGTAAATRDADLKALEKQGRALGYKLQVHDGQQYFCRVTTPTGKRIPVNDCISPEGLQSQLALQSTERYKLPTNSACLSKSCSGN